METDGRYSILEVIFPSDQEGGISLHKHSREDVMVYVIEGNFFLRIIQKVFMEIKEQLSNLTEKFRTRILK